MRAWFAFLSLAFGFAAAPSVSAEPDFARVVAGLRRAAAPSPAPFALPRAFLGRDGRVSLLAERFDASAAPPAFARSIDGHFFALELAPADAAGLDAGIPGFRLEWSPPRHLLLDRAVGWAHVADFRAAGGGSGRGVVVGVVDTGIDSLHGDFRRSDGSTRVKWLIDFTRAPAGLEPDLEAAFGCTSSTTCAIYKNTDIDALVANDVSGDEPVDSVGHGTHVASLAAGNGLSQSPPRYVGIAPESDIVVARITDGQSGITDGLILQAVSFVFDRAQNDLNEPAVVNLSLGSDLGAHDGSSSLERALTSFIGPDQPGRALVVAAGNSGALYRDANSQYPGPFGVHAEVNVARDSPASVPIVTPGLTQSMVLGRMSLWVETRAGDALSLGVERNGKLIGSMAAPGASVNTTQGELSLVVLNGVGSEGDDTLAKNSLLAVIGGQWAATDSFSLRFSGHGTASLWIEGEGDLDPTISVGPLFPFAQKEGTIDIPASAPDLIAVGATLNRTDWIDSDGDAISQPQNGALLNSPPDTTSFFSAAGPNALGGLKPDIVAPGANVIGAMSSLVDPRTDPNSMFAGNGVCDDGVQCFRVDDQHAVASGTSMAAPLVTGAVALLLERDPTLTQAELRALLQAGARPLEGVVTLEQQAGLGALDLSGALLAATSGESAARVLPGAQSKFVLAASYAHPDPNWPLVAYAELRGDDGRIADGFDARRLALAVNGASIVDALTRVAPGLYRFSVVAPAGSGNASLELVLSFDDGVLVTRDVPIAVDQGALTQNISVRGGCDVARTRSGPSSFFLWVALCALLRSRRRPRACS